MLIECPECKLQVSNKALSCPHCGYPLTKQANITRNNRKHKRLPNGFGAITKISNKNLRKPYRVMVTTGMGEDGAPIRKLLKPTAYFATYNEAYEALIEYNKSPYDLDSDITVEKLFEKWTSGYFSTLKSESSIRNITAAWAYCSDVYKMRVKDLRTRHIKGCMEEGKALIHGKYKSASSGTQTRIKSMFNLMLDYAVEYEIVDKNYSRAFDVSSDVIKDMNNAKQEHIAFTSDEMDKLWENINVEYVDIVLIQCYMGWRPQELGLIETDKVDLDKNIITGGMKTPAGIDRTVPICSKIRPIIEAKYKEAVKNGTKYLITCTDGRTHKNYSKLTYDKYQSRFKKVVTTLDLNPQHRAHDPRKQFVTMCKSNNVNDYAIKYVVGHQISDITESVYTERNVEWLNSEIEKIC